MSEGGGGGGAGGGGGEELELLFEYDFRIFSQLIVALSPVNHKGLYQMISEVQRNVNGRRTEEGSAAVHSVVSAAQGRLFSIFPGQTSRAALSDLQAPVLLRQPDLRQLTKACRGSMSFCMKHLVYCLRSRRGLQTFTACTGSEHFLVRSAASWHIGFLKQARDHSSGFLVKSERERERERERGGGMKMKETRMTARVLIQGPNT